MSETMMTVLNVLLGSFFFGLMIFAFYKALFSKSSEQEQPTSGKQAPKSTRDKRAKTKFVGRT